MTADSLDLEDCNDAYKEIIGSFTSYDEMSNLTLLESDYFCDAPKLQPVQPSVSASSNSFSDMKNPKYINDDIYSDFTQFKLEDYLSPAFDDDLLGDSLVDSYKLRSSDSDMSLQSSSLLDMDSDILSTSVSPDLILPNSIASNSVTSNTITSSSITSSSITSSSITSSSVTSSSVALNSIVPNSISSPIVKEEVDSGDEAVSSCWPEVSRYSEIKLLKFVDGYVGDDLVPMEDLLSRKKKRRKLTHLDFDHCYSQRPIEEDDEEEDDTYDYFNTSLYSPASSTCSDKTRGVKRGARPKRKAVKQIKIKEEIMTSDEEEVDVETPCPISLVVPKITISLAPPPVKTGPAKRGRKPKNKIVEVQTVKKTNNKHCPVSPRDLQAAIKQQKQKCYITKSGRVSNKISNSVETTPSTSTPSSLNNSRCTSDNEDNVDKRASHNMAERNRRQELTNLFQNLRKTVTSIEKNTKASKVLILQSAAKFIGHLEKDIKGHVSEERQLRAEVERKLAIVQSLRNNRGYSS